MNTRRARLFFFGDSICNGQGVAIHKGWVTRLSAMLYDWPGPPIEIANSSVNGRTTRQALESMPYEIQSQNPDALVVQFGMNDCNCWATDRGLPRVSGPAFLANMEEIVARAFAFGVRCVFIHTNHPTGRDLEPMPNTRLTYQEGNEEYNRILRNAFAQRDERIVLVDIEDAFRQRIRSRSDLERLLLPDLLHLSEAGHDLYFEVVSGVLLARLPGFLP